MRRLSSALSHDLMFPYDVTDWDDEDLEKKTGPTIEPCERPYSIKQCPEKVKVLLIQTWLSDQ